MKGLAKAVFTGLLLAVLGAGFFHTTYGERLEEELGLAVLFKLRGPRQPPAQAVIVNIEESSPEALYRPGNIGRLPRAVHAALVDRLRQYGAAVIAFDVFFSEAENLDEDTAFAEAVRQAGNVILVEDLRHASITPAARGEPNPVVEVEHLVPPIGPLADAALASVPFPLPKTPIRVSRAWRFKDSCGDVPTLPAAVFQVKALGHYERLHALLLRKAPEAARDLPNSAQEAIATLGLVETMRKIRRIFLQHQTLREMVLAESGGGQAEAPPSASGRDFQALLEMYGGESNSIIDFYGPPTTCPTLSYREVLSPPENMQAAIDEKIRGKAVFIGAARTDWSNQKDGFHTVFSAADGLDLSGVELAATVFTNLAENRSVHPLSPATSVWLIGICALTACLFSFLLPPPYTGIMLLAGIAVYLFGAFAVFAHSGTWMPLVIPAALVPFCGFLTATLSNYLTAHRERRNIHTALALYLPGSVVEELVKDPSFITTGCRKMYGVCVMTDARHYTTLSECLEPEELSRHMKDYYRHLFQQVKNNGGVVCNMIGDSMLALWPSARPEASLCGKACCAALQMTAAIKLFNEQNPGRALPTRIGLHAGYLLMDNIGAEDHFEYAPVGDVVNTASRIEGLNKHLGSTILASEEALGGGLGLKCREIGCFLFGGKTRPVNIYEVIAAEESADATTWNRLHTELFPEAVRLFRQGQWDKALAAFDRCLGLNGEDGPSRFYRRLCQAYLARPPAAELRHIIQVGK